MILPQTAEYALRAVIHLASRGTDGGARAHTLADVAGVPRNYLAKTLHVLARAGVLRSTRGPLGGFQLARPASETTVAQVVAPFVDTVGRRCLLQDRPCSADTACEVHVRWSPVARELHAFFERTTIADLVAEPGRRDAPWQHPSPHSRSS